jgi:hypothetical protein
LEMVHTNKLAVLVLSVAAMGAPAGGKPRPSGETLIVHPNQIVSGSVNGKAMNFQLLAWAPSTLILNPEPAESLGLKAGLFSGKLVVGKTRDKVLVTVAQYAIGSQATKGQIGWTNRAISPTASGWLGPGAAPFDVVTFQLRPAEAGETPYTLPLVLAGGGMVTTIRAGEKDLTVMWDNSRGGTIVSEAAGAEIAKANGGSFYGPAATEMVQLNAERPTRKLRLATPLRIGPISIGDVSVRTSEGGESDIPDPDADPSEMLVAVNAKSKIKPDYLVFVGLNDMKNCSSLTFDKPAKLIRLMCRP